jgi:hypothetical protein
MRPPPSPSPYASPYRTNDAPPSLCQVPLANIDMRWEGVGTASMGESLR